MTDHEANLVMSMVEYLNRCATGVILCSDNTQQAAAATINHLYELHKLRDMEIWVDLSDKVYSDYYEAERTLNLWRDIDHA